MALSDRLGCEGWKKENGDFFKITAWFTWKNLGSLFVYANNFLVRTESMSCTNKSRSKKYVADGMRIVSK